VFFRNFRIHVIIALSRNIIKALHRCENCQKLKKFESKSFVLRINIYEDALQKKWWNVCDLEFADNAAVIVLDVSSLLSTEQLECVQPLAEAVELCPWLKFILEYLSTTHDNRLRISVSTNLSFLPILSACYWNSPPVFPLSAWHRRIYVKIWESYELGWKRDATVSEAASEAISITAWSWYIFLLTTKTIRAALFWVLCRLSSPATGAPYSSELQ